MLGSASGQFLSHLSGDEATSTAQPPMRNFLSHLSGDEAVHTGVAA